MQMIRVGIDVFERVQSKRQRRSNMVMDEEGIAHRRESHYSMKAALSEKGDELIQAKTAPSYSDLRTKA
jgi:hypothetical protein